VTIYIYKQIHSKYSSFIWSI